MGIKIFDYMCPSCGHREDDYAIRDGDEVTCPQCGTKMERELGATPTTFRYHDRKAFKTGNR